MHAKVAVYADFFAEAFLVVGFLATVFLAGAFASAAFFTGAFFVALAFFLPFFPPAAGRMGSYSSIVTVSGFISFGSVMFLPAYLM